jgi:hypothetical protein
LCDVRPTENESVPDGVMKSFTSLTRRGLADATTIGTVVEGVSGRMFFKRVNIIPFDISAGNSIFSSVRFSSGSFRYRTVTRPLAASIVDSIGWGKVGPFWIRWSLTSRNRWRCVNTTVSSWIEPSGNRKTRRLVTRSPRADWIRSPSARRVPSSAFKARNPRTTPSE